MTKKVVIIAMKVVRLIIKVVIAELESELPVCKFKF